MIEIARPNESCSHMNIASIRRLVRRSHASKGVFFMRVRGAAADP